MRKVIGSTYETLRNRVIKEAKRDLEFGFLLAEFDFEWLLRRLILCYSTCPTVVVRSLLKRCSGFEWYVKAWDECVKQFRPGCSDLSAILKIPSKNQISKGKINKTFLKRHLLVHGARNCIGSISALTGIDVMMESSALLVNFAGSNGVDLFKRISPRQHTCVFCQEKKQNTSGNAIQTCARGVKGECPFLRDAKLSRKIRKGICEQKLARQGSGITLTCEELTLLAEKYDLKNDPQIQKVLKTIQTASRCRSAN